MHNIITVPFVVSVGGAKYQLSDSCLLSMMVARQITDGSLEFWGRFFVYICIAVEWNCLSYRCGSTCVRDCKYMLYSTLFVPCSLYCVGNTYFTNLHCIIMLQKKVIRLMRVECLYVWMGALPRSL